MISSNMHGDIIGDIVILDRPKMAFPALFLLSFCNEVLRAVTAATTTEVDKEHIVEGSNYRVTKKPPKIQLIYVKEPILISQYHH